MAQRSGGDASDTDGKPEGRATGARASQTPLQLLLSHFLELLTDYRSVKAIEGDACLAVALAKAEANTAFRLLPLID